MTIESFSPSIAQSTNIITDGQLSCVYHELPTLFNQFDDYFASAGVTPNQAVAFECSNSVPGALTLLYLLTRGYGLLLLPPPPGKDTSFRPPLPQFCQTQIIVQPTETLTPSSFLLFEKNNQYQPKPIETKNKLFMRTSGSMGRSKIVVHTHTNLIKNATNCIERFHLEANDKVTLPVPIFHMYGLGAGFLPSILVGASIDLQEKTNILKYLQRERTFAPTVAFFTPNLCEMLIKGKRNPRPYKTVVTAGARIKETIFREFATRFGGLVNLYGSTEMGAIAATEPTDSVEIRATTIGKPMRDVMLELRTDDNEHSTQGELYCQHAYGYEAYLDETGQQISVAETWYQTGDLAERLSDGFIKILGRLGNSVNRRGYLVLFSDIEREIEKIDAVEQVVVVKGQQETEQGPELIAFCVLQRGIVLSDIELRQHCFDYLPKHAIPDHIYLLKTLPTLPSGKINRQALIQKLNPIQ